MKLTLLPTIKQETIELLQAVGYMDLAMLAQAGADHVMEELGKANDLLQIVERLPEMADIDLWISASRQYLREHHPDYELQMSEESARLPENSPIDQVLEEIPTAMVLPLQPLIDQQIRVIEVMAAPLVKNEVDLNLLKQAPMVIYEDFHKKVTTKFRGVDEFNAFSPQSARAAAGSDASDRVNLLRMPRASTNEGIDSKSRRYIRGVLHNKPGLVLVGAAVTFVFMLLIPVSVLSAITLILAADFQADFSFVIQVLVVLSGLAPAAGFLYLMFAIHSSCRICGQKLFVKKAHLKNPKAHHVTGLGYIFPLCIHILLFRWFRCTHCGTPVRLKE